MADVLHFPSSPTTGPPSSSSSSSQPFRCDPQEEAKRREKQSRDQLSFLALLVTVLRKSLAACKSDRKELGAMDIGWPTNVRHVAHVTFDRFNGFSGLPVEFEPEVPRRPPSASATVFGVSAESMQLSYDSRGNSVPTILLLMQRRLYDQGGLQAEGIFRINAENSQEEYVRNQLNKGVVEDSIDVHCLAGLIKAWFRELPTGVLDSLSTEQVMQCQTEEQCAELARLLPPTEASLLDWSINLMADVAKKEQLNKMNARNIAMVFAPNMTQMADPLTALMYAVQVMNFLKTLIVRTLRERRDSVVEPTLASQLEPNDGNGDRSGLNSIPDADTESEETEQVLMAPNLIKGSPTDLVQSADIVTAEYDADYPPKSTACIGVSMSEVEPSTVNILKGNMQINSGQSSRSSTAQELRKLNQQPSEVQTTSVAVKTKGMSNLSRIDSRIDQSEAWR